MERINKTILDVLEGLQSHKNNKEYGRVREILKKNLAKKAYEHVELYNLKDGILSLKVGSSSWLYYLRLEKENLLGKIKKQYSAIKDIRFSLGDYK